MIRRRVSIGAAAMAIGLVACCVLAACMDTSDWKPSGEVKFIELREDVDALGAKKGSLDYRISNGGKSRIAGTRFAFTFATDRKKYHLTVVDANAIASGALVYGQVAVAYDETEETGSLAGAAIDSVQFE